MIVSNLTTYKDLPWQDYIKLPGLSFSGTKDFAITEPTYKMKLGTALDQYLTEPHNYDGFEVDMIRKAAVEVRKKLGTLWPKLYKQYSYTCTLSHGGFSLQHKGRTDFVIPGKILIDLKFVETSVASHFDYPSQLSGYSLSLGCPVAYILEMSRKNGARFIPITIKPDFWIKQILLRGEVCPE